MWESCVDKLVEILLCEGGDAELCARTSKHILAFAFAPLVSQLSLYLLCAKLHPYHHIIFACVEHNSYCHIISLSHVLRDRCIIHHT